MDLRSASTFCTEDLVKQLNLTGRKTKIFLTTMNQRGFVDSHWLTGLEVSGLEECTFIDLPKVFPQKEIPVSEMPKEVNNWPYLKDVKLPYINADVGLLIGNNAYQAVEPWRVINS